ncbi:MAG TPA: ribose 5-phosphate isomerase B [Candidatus Acidoferrales bacterium]|nr:ribose 5-phosphate isomerase B [Candidatus Acidoferrales bacterium]
MRIGMGADHAGYLLKDQLVAMLREAKHDVTDFGTNGPAAVDYPDFAQAVGEALIAGRVERGIVICGSGVGACIAANKIPGIRACMCHDSYSAHQGVQHDNMNVLVLGARVIGPMLAQELVNNFLNAKYWGNEKGQERLQRRVDKIDAIEKKYSLPARAGKELG